MTRRQRERLKENLKKVEKLLKNCEKISSRPYGYITIEEACKSVDLSVDWFRCWRRLSEENEIRFQGARCRLYGLTG
jgi:hypothetical protein